MKREGTTNLSLAELLLRSRLFAPTSSCWSISYQRNRGILRVLVALTCLSDRDDDDDLICLLLTTVDHLIDHHAAAGVPWRHC